MIKGLFQKRGFVPAKFIEINDELVNPERGWYQIHTFKLGEDISMKDREYTLNTTDTLALVLIDISNYRLKPLDELAVNQLHMIFDFFRDYRLDMVVRVVYDTIGKCMETEPEDESVVISHMNTLGPILHEYSGEIFVYQGLLIGNWGEMHSSKFLSPNRLKRLADVILKELENTAYLAVRRPAYVRILFPEGEDVRQSRVGLFDDAILASPTHMGTFGNQSRLTSRRDKSWKPDEEMEYVTELCDRVPYGGEALWTDETDELTGIRGSLSLISDYFQNLHLSYLNRIHDPVFLQKLREMTWNKKDVFKGLDGYEYIGRHLGYRFVIRKVECNIDKSTDTVTWEIEIDNIGFSRVFFESESYLRGLDENGNEKIIDISEWMQLSTLASKERHTFNIQTEPLFGEVFLYSNKKSTKRAVFFANQKNSDDCKEGEIALGRVN